MRKTFSLFIAVVFLSVAVLAVGADLYSNISPKRMISPIVVSNNDNTVGQIVDRLGFGSVTFLIETGTLADSDVTLTPTIQVCALDNCDDFASAAAGDLIGTIAGATFTAANDNSVKMVAYKGTKRYVRLNVLPANNTGSAPFSVITILGHPQYRPVP